MSKAHTLAGAGYPAARGAGCTSLNEYLATRYMLLHGIFMRLRRHQEMTPASREGVNERVLGLHHPAQDNRSEINPPWEVGVALASV